MRSIAGFGEPATGLELHFIGGVLVADNVYSWRGPCYDERSQRASLTIAPYSLTLLTMPSVRPPRSISNIVPGDTAAFVAVVTCVGSWAGLLSLVVLTFNSGTAPLHLTAWHAVLDILTVTSILTAFVGVLHPNTSSVRRAMAIAALIFVSWPAQEVLVRIAWR